jgi:phenylacetate-coenzyme A ligase PaaK-like adenylate-forming protein
MNDPAQRLPTDLGALHALKEARFRRMIELCFAAHPYYRARFAELGLAKRDIGSLSDLARIPTTAKSAYMAAPEAFRLEPDRLAEGDRAGTTLWNIAYTTGTTSGRPSPFFNTTHDQLAIMMQARRCGEAEGWRPGDLVANLVPLPPMPTGGFLVVGRTAEAMGVPIVYGLTGAANPDYPVHRSLDQAIDVLKAAEPTVLFAIPSFLRQFLRRTVERGIAFPRARMIITTGEPVSPGMRDEFLGRLRAFGCPDPQIRQRYSFTEMQGGLVQCCNGATLQNVMPDLYHLETVDPETGRPMPEGEEGALAVTHLDRRGTVFLRYLVGDMAALRLEACPDCGALGERLIARPRRSDALLKVKGMLINPGLIADALTADPDIREFQIAAVKAVADDPDSPDALEIRIEAAPEAQNRLATTVTDTVQRLTYIRPRVRFVPAGSIFDPLANLKAKRVIDERAR